MMMFEIIRIFFSGKTNKQQKKNQQAGREETKSTKQTWGFVVARRVNVSNRVEAAELLAPG